MRKLIGLLAACGIIAATIVPALACDYKTNASNDQAQKQQTAQAQSDQRAE